MATLTARPIRSLAVAVALVLVAGFLTTAWAIRGADDDVDLRHEPTADDGGELALAPADLPGANPERTGGGSSTDPDAAGADGGPTGDGDPGSSTATTDPDRDDDGVRADGDNCPDLSNPDQADLDGDGEGDACDPDDDGDEVADSDDNCPLDANGTQDDVDGDGLGDACDDFPDRDDDGIIDTQDPCVEEPDEPDTDGDGTPDGCDESPRGMVVTAASARVERITILNDAYDGEPDMFGDLTVAGTNIDLPEIADQRDIRPTDWATDLIAVEPDATEVQVRIWIRDEAECLFCRDRRVDLTPEPESNDLRLLIDTATGEVYLATDDWERRGVVGTLTGPDDGNWSGTITQQGDDDEVHIGSVDLTLTLIREPAP